MMPSKHEDIATALAHLTDAIQAQATKPQSPRRRRGRPSLGIRAGYARVELWLRPDMVSALDQLASGMEQRTGQRVCRADVIRTAIERYLHAQMLPEAGI